MSDKASAARDTSKVRHGVDHHRHVISDALLFVNGSLQEQRFRCNTRAPSILAFRPKPLGAYKVADSYSSKCAAGR